MFFLCLWKGDIRTGYAEEGNAAKTQPDASSGYQQTVETTILNEKQTLEELKACHKLAEDDKRALLTEMNAYRIQASAYSNILLLPQTPTRDLENAWTQNVNAMYAADQKIKDLAEKIADIDKQLTDVTEQIDLNNQQLQDFQTGATQDVQTNGIKKNIQNLINLLMARQNRLTKIKAIYANQETQLQDVHQTMVDLSKRFDEQIQTRKKQELFQRAESPMKTLSVEQIQNDVQEFVIRVQSLLSLQFWMDHSQNIWATGAYFQIVSILILAVSVFFLFRMRGYFIRTVAPLESGQFPWRNLGITILHRSIIWIGLTVFWYAYIQIRGLWVSSPLLRMMFNMLLLGLFTRWALDTLLEWNRLMVPRISKAVGRLLKFLIIGVSLLSGILIILGWLMALGNIIQIFFRMIMEIGLVIWMVIFIRTVKSEIDLAYSPLPKKFRIIKSSASVIGYGVVMVSLILEVTGYNHMAAFWQISVVKMLMSLMWISLVFFIIREWEKGFRSETSDIHLIPAQHSFRWLGIQLIRVLWFFASVVILLLCWGAKHAVIVNVFKVINYSIPVGDIRFSLLNVFYALLSIVLTVLATRLWRQALREKIFNHGGLDAGLQDSIMTLTVYLIWAMGLFVSLRVIGVSATSLTVVFGALSIGLGFGLQNIFNNFISGIILLFERPIQIGDAVEINGIWGIVKKINFRSTLVQTYDNASLIIPNSEFISNSVTNWSFKDQRLRRIISIGVAYGTDARMTADTLLGIAQSCPWVLANPKPDVLFSDFGDSALIFKLRIWTILDHMIAAENDIRYRINQTFAEKGIEIPFPQQDVHIRSGLPSAAGASS